MKKFFEKGNKLYLYAYITKRALQPRKQKSASLVQQNKIVGDSDLTVSDLSP